ncbi:DNA polymerase II subunit B4-like [Lactuca sativa]|uniref:DNA polymerase II subunit B4-like n=1 Tax=Lactuca sativa TaxID=4236 RepID=UPI000CD90E16|nr:DNA polymerase II subunit B4-like [Lactuca sativa]
MWPSMEFIAPLPPLKRNIPSRPKVNRIKDASERGARHTVSKKRKRTYGNDGEGSSVKKAMDGKYEQGTKGNKGTNGNDGEGSSSKKAMDGKDEQGTRGNKGTNGNDEEGSCGKKAMYGKDEQGGRGKTEHDDDNTHNQQCNYFNLLLDMVEPLLHVEDIHPGMKLLEFIVSDDGGGVGSMEDIEGKREYCRMVVG